MLFQIKSKPEDFIVEEILPEGFPSGKGDFLYVFFEKENLTTMDIIDYLTKSLHLQRDELGIAGLKDKAGITRQWISVSKRSLSVLGGEELFVKTLGEKFRILEKFWNESGLKVASNAGNNFKIRLRARQKISNEIKNQIENNVQKIRERGFPNCFGMQRFGKGKKNFYEAKDRLKVLAKEYNESGELKESDLPYHLRFLLQAYPSMYFNEYVLNRWEKGLFLLQGDILVDRFNSNGVKTAVYDSQNVYLFDYQKLKKEKADLNFFEPQVLSFGAIAKNPGNVMQMDSSAKVYTASGVSEGQGIPPTPLIKGENPKDGGITITKCELHNSDKRFPTGPMLGWNLLLPPQGTKARVRDDQLLQLAEFNEGMQQVCKIYNLRGIRRVLFIQVPALKFEWDNDDIVLEFSLPTGSYATTLVSFILQGIDYLTLKDNSLIIPRISNK